MADGKTGFETDGPGRIGGKIVVPKKSTNLLCVRDDGALA